MSFTKPRYDASAYRADLKQSVAPMQYEMYLGAHVNGNRCSPLAPQEHFSQVDIESDMLGLNRFHAKTVEKMYTTTTTGAVAQVGAYNAISTFDPRAHVNVNPAVCADVTKHLIFNSGVQRPIYPGYTMPNPQIGCSTR